MRWLNWWSRNQRFVKPCLEAAWYLSIAKIMIVFLPFQSWKKRCGHYQCETLKIQTNDTQVPKDLARAIKFTAKMVPWPSKCLDQALAAQRMLARRQLNNTLYLGMKKTNDQQWLAHAWVRCQDAWVIGYQPNMRYTVVGTYAWISQYA